MATKESMQEENKDFGEAFAEDAPAVPAVSDDDAFGLSLPGAEEIPDDNSGTGEAPSVTIEIEGEPAPAEAPVEDAPHGEMPVGGEGEVDAVPVDVPAEDGGETVSQEAVDTPVEEVAEVEVDPEMTQNERTWEGRLRKREEELAAREAELEGKGDDSVGDEAMQSAIAQLTSDFGDEFVNAVMTIAKGVASGTAAEHVGEINKTVSDVIDDIKNSRAKRHFEDIFDAHPDFVDVYESQEFKDWLAGLEGDEKAETERVVNAGSAREINRLLTRYKQREKAGEVSEGGNESALDDAEGVRSTGIRLPEAPAAADDDYLKTWNQG